MSERPSFQFYPGAWRNNAKLSRCSPSARGSWMDILCVLHDEDEYGVARYPLAELAGAARVPVEDTQELAAKGVLKGCDAGPVTYQHTPRHARQDGEPVTLVHSAAGPCWFSSRMLVDEWRRNTKGKATRFTDSNGAHPSPSRSPSAWQGAGSSSSSSPSVSSATAEGQETANQLATLSAILSLPQTDFNKQASNLITLSQLKAEGCDFAADILPAAQRAAKTGQAIRSLRYIVASARESRDGRKTLAGLPAAFEPTTEAGWRDRLRVWKDRAGWLAKWGPDPNSPDCNCPPAFLADIIKPAGANVTPFRKTEDVA